MGEHPNQSQPNPGLRADGSPCTGIPRRVVNVRMGEGRVETVELRDDALILRLKGTLFSSFKSSSDEDCFESNGKLSSYQEGNSFS